MSHGRQNEVATKADHTRLAHGPNPALEQK
jgi:hypothetical protein